MIDGPDEGCGARPLIHVALATSGETKKSPWEGGIAKASCLPKESGSWANVVWEYYRKSRGIELISL